MFKAYAVKLGQRQLLDMLRHWSSDPKTLQRIDATD